MQKKILLSLLIASPTAMPALADINFGYGDWSTPQGVDGGVAGTYDKTTGSLNSTLNSGFSKYVVTLQPGQYTLNFTEANNLALTVSQNGKELDATVSAEDSAMSVSFKVETEGDVTMTATCEVAGLFSFKGAQLSLDFDFVAAGNALTDRIKAIKFTKIDDEKFPGAQALLDRKNGTENETGLATLKKQYKEIAKQLADDSTDEKALLDIYKTWMLYNDPSALDEAVTELGKNVDAWNEEVANLNTQIANTAANTEAKATLVAEKDQLVAGINALLQNIDEVCSNYPGLIDPKQGAVAELKGKVNGLLTAVNNYGKAIDTAYADLASAIVDFPSQAQGFQEQLAGLQTDWTALQKNWNDYTTIMNTIINGLENARANAEKAIGDLAGVEGKEGNFDTQKNAALTEIQNIYTAAKAQMPTPDVDTASKVIEAYQSALKTAQDEMNKVVTDLTTLVTTQNEAYQQATGQINYYKEQLAACQFDGMPADIQTEYNGIETELNSLQSAVDTAYGKAALPVADFAETLDEINNEINALKDKMGPAIAINTLKGQLVNLDAYIKNLSDELNKKESGVVDLYNLFGNPGGTLDNIKTMVSDLTPENLDANKKGLEDSMKQAKADADSLYGAYNELIEADQAFAKEVKDLEEFVMGRTEIDAAGNEVKPADSTFKPGLLNGNSIQTKYNNFHSALLGLDDNADTPQAVYDNAQTMLDEFKEGEYTEPTLASVELELAQEITNNNMKHLTALVANGQKLLDENEFTGEDKLQTELTEIQTTVEGISTAIDDADTVEDYAKADTDIVEAAKEINALNAKIKQYIGNQQAYNDLLGRLTPGLQSRIDELLALNERLSKDGAKDYFDNEINGADNANSLQAGISNLEEALAVALKAFDPTNPDTAINNVKYPDSNGVTFSTAIDNLTVLFNNMADMIPEYNLVHNGQLATAEYLANLIDATRNAIDAAKLATPDLQEWYQGFMTQLDDLEEPLYNNNVAVANAYESGNTLNTKTELNKKYDDIKAAIDEISYQIASKYNQAVIDSNNSIVDASGWEATTRALSNQYVLAIQEFNKYFYGLENDGWKNTVLPIVKRHLAIYDYSQAINDLIADVRTYVNNANALPNPTAFTAEQFAAVATDKANALIAEMQAKMDTLNSEAAEAATAYYNTLHQQAKTQIDGYQQKLNNAGIVSNCLNQVKAALQDAEGGWTVANDPLQATQPLGLAMDRIADNLDDALAPVDLQTVAENAWNNAYKTVANNVNSILSALRNPSSSDYLFADPELRQQNTEAIAELQGDLTELNAEVDAVDEDLIDSYAGFKQRLDALMRNINTLDQAVKDNSKNNKANQDLYNSLTGEIIPGFETGLQALIAYADTLVGGQQYSTDSIQTAIDDLKQFVEQNAGKLTKVEYQINSKKNAIKNAITNGYGSVAYFEQQYLADTLVPMVKVAFNDAKAAFMGAAGTISNLDKETGMETINDWNEDIDGYTTSVADLANMLGSKFDENKFRTAAQALETQLTDLYVEMEQTWTSDSHDGTNPVPAVIAELENRYNEVDAAIDASKAYLDGCTPSLDTTEYAAALAAAEKALAAEKAAWQSVGNRVLVMKPTYMANMEEIAEEVAKTQADMQAANEKQIANDNAYAALSTELANLKAELERVKALANGWYPGEYDGILNYYGELLTASEENLNELNAAVELNSVSTLLYGSDIARYISTVEMKVMNRQAEDQRILAQKGLVSVNEALQANIVPEELAIIEANLAKLNGEYTANYGKQTGADGMPVTVAVLDEVIAEYERIQAEAETLRADAVENSYVPGDVDLNPDGIVSAIDVQQIVNWVLDGVTWQELYEESPRRAYAADLNGNKRLDITDVAMDIALVYGEEPTARRLARFAAPAMDQAESMNIELVSEENGVRRFAIMLNNPTDMIAGQIDLKLAAGMSVSEVTAGERAEGHSLETMEHGSDTVRVVLYSMENAAFSGNNGAVIYVDVVGKGNLKAENVLFTDTYFNTHEMRGSDSSFISDVWDSAKEMGSRFYNAAGVMFNKMQNGINIFRTKDGKVKKQYNRNTK